ncbi:hypothetical protein EMERY_58 [Brevibacillus phage Emery]|nr:hypothetical protein EMERY_58 [Brevibacillus phage Emery]
MLFVPIKFSYLNKFLFCKLDLFMKILERLFLNPISSKRAKLFRMVNFS